MGSRPRQPGSTPPVRGADGGFTLVELVLTVVVIGILAAVAIPSYVAARAGAEDAVLQADLAHAKTATIAWRTATAAAGAPDIDSQLREWGYRSSGYAASGSAPAFRSGSTSSLFCVVGTSGSGQQLSITTNGAVRKGACPSSSTDW